MQISFCCLLPHACRLLNHLIRSREELGRKSESDPLCCLQVDHKLELCCLLHRQIGWFSTFQDLVHINSRAPIEVIVVYAVGHETALIDKFLLKVNSRQPVFYGKFHDPFSFGEKGASGERHNRIDLLLLCSLKGDL